MGEDGWKTEVQRRLRKAMAAVEAADCEARDLNTITSLTKALADVTEAASMLRQARDDAALTCRVEGIPTRRIAAAAGVTGPYVSRLALGNGLPSTRGA